MRNWNLPHTQSRLAIIEGIKGIGCVVVNADKVSPLKVYEASFKD